MLSKPIPAWILLGGAGLAAVAGCVNVIGFLGLQHQALSHLSGTVTNLGGELARGDATATWHALRVIGFFFFGSVLSGLIIRESTLRFGPRYGVALIVESMLLGAAAYLLRHDSVTGNSLAAMACGLQNAMASSYSGAVIRTSHMTGIVTDLGIALGLAARRERVDRRRVGLYLVLLSGFFAGSALGALGFFRLQYDTLLIPAALTGGAGIAYTLWRRTRPTPAR